MTSAVTTTAAAARRPALRVPGGPLALVSVAFALLQIALGPARLGLGWDETVYVSQVAPKVPAAYFSAPRSRGVPLLVAPVAGFVTSTAAIRAYLVLLGALGLYLAFRVWLRLLPPTSVAVAAGLFACLWPTLFYASEAMPNYWIAVLGVAAAGSALVAAHDRAASAYFSLGLCVAAMGLIRPSDAAWFALPILVGALVMRSWRRTLLLPVTAGGLVVGVTPWIIEAFVRFGGPLQRLHDSSVNEGGLSPHLGFLYQARALYGPLLCRPCTHATRPLVLDIWWMVLPVLVLIAVLTFRGTTQFSPLLLAATCGASVAAPYLFLVGYAAPRFLLPAYALVALPLGHWFVLLCRVAWGHRRALAVALGAAGALFAVAQAAVTALQVPVQQVDRHNYAHIAKQLHALGVRAPCELGGPDAPPVAYYTGCSSLLAQGSKHPKTTAAWQAYARQHNYAVVLQGPGPPPSYARSWRRYTFRHMEKHQWVALLPPR